MEKRTTITESILFICITLGLSYFVFWGPIALFKVPTISFVSSIKGPIWAIVLFMFGGFIPSIAAIALTYFRDGSNGLKSLFKRFKHINIGFKWYAATLVIFMIIGFGQIMINSVLGNQFDFSLYLKQIGSLLPLIIIGPLSEEFGWRGYLLEKLQIFLKPIIASLIVGTVWGLWHLPLFYMVGTSQHELNLPFLSFILSTISMSIIMTYLYNNTKSSIWSAVFAHWVYTYIAQVNATGVTRSTTYNWLEAVPSIVIAIIIIFIMNKRKKEDNVTT